ncbi:hypothetical protein [Spirulina sp. 06S082]|uniref:hypothetical protein n=1 Tax=Spirulina sp. 06S082 TaxID=3110248 RepID=UPI002B1EB6E8|nr:hypothetical protein [Spirulina sp. 06S082]MEA5467996.1 hypothetical protein [Spirulina sp. 06S082]
MFDPDIFALTNHISSVVREQGYLVGMTSRTLNTDCFNLKIARSPLNWIVDLTVCNDVLAGFIWHSLKNLTFSQAIELNIKVGSKIIIPSLQLKLSKPRTPMPKTILTNLFDYQKELQDKKGAIFGVCLVQDKNLAVSPEATKLMGVSECELLSRDLRLYWYKKDIAYNPAIIAKSERPKALKEFIQTLKQQSVLDNHSYQGWKDDIWGTWTANIKVREIAPFHLVREHEALEFVPAG